MVDSLNLSVTSTSEINFSRFQQEINSSVLFRLRTAGYLAQPAKRNRK